MRIQRPSTQFILPPAATAVNRIGVIRILADSDCITAIRLRVNPWRDGVWDGIAVQIKTCKMQIGVSCRDQFALCTFQFALCTDLISAGANARMMAALSSSPNPAATRELSSS